MYYPPAEDVDTPPQPRFLHREDDNDDDVHDDEDPHHHQQQQVVTTPSNAVVAAAAAAAAAAAVTTPTSAQQYHYHHTPTANASTHYHVEGHRPVDVHAAHTPTSSSSNRHGGRERTHRHHRTSARRSSSHHHQQQHVHHTHVDEMSVEDDEEEEDVEEEEEEEDDDAADDDDEEEEEEEEEEDGDTTGSAAGGAGTGGNNNSTSNANSSPVLVVQAVPNLDSLYGLREIGREALCWQLSSAKPGNGVEQIRDHSTETYWQSDGTSQPHWIQVHFARRVAISHVCLYLDYNLDESYTPRRLSVQVGMTNQDLVPAILPSTTVVEFQEPVGWCIVPLMTSPDVLDDAELEDDDDDDIVASNDQRRSSSSASAAGGGLGVGMGMDMDDLSIYGIGGAGIPNSQADTGTGTTAGTTGAATTGNATTGATPTNTNNVISSSASQPATIKRVVKAHLIQISIIAQHQNGRDTHIRQVQLYGPRATNSTTLKLQQGASKNAMPGSHSNNIIESGTSAMTLLHRTSRLCCDEEFRTVAMSQFSTIR